jgi:steroid delta-isomerase
MAIGPEQVRKVIESYARAWATDDRALLISLFAEDAQWSDPVGTPPFAGHAGVGAFWDFAHQDPGRQLKPVVHRIVACANEGLLDFTMQVRAPALNQGLDLHVVDRFVLNEHGKIQTAQAYWDEASAAAPPGMDFLVPDLEDAYEK